MRRDDLKAKGHQILHRMVPASIAQAQLHRRVIMQFAEKAGLVYFGYVDQRNDEHRLVRGLTLSTNHRDNHYCIGTYDAYDIALVDRQDTIHYPGKSTKTHNWIIMTFDLHTSVDLPHIFVGLHTHSETFYSHLFTKFSKLTHVPLSDYGPYDKTFSGRYAIYTTPDQFIHTTSLLNPSLTKAIGDHFGSLTFEIADKTLYLYADDQRTSSALLEKMLKYGVWLAQSIDAHVA